MEWTSETLFSLEKEKRTQLINALSGYKSIHLIGTINLDKQLNLAPFTSVFHLGADPALIGFIHRPTNVEKHTYENIKATGYYTLNSVHYAILNQAHQCSARYPRNMSEFEANMLTPRFDRSFPAPFVSESHIQIGLKFEEEHLIMNGTHLIVGSIQYLFVHDELITSEGNLQLDLGEISVNSGLDSYYDARFLKRLSYAKPNTPLIEL